MASIGNRKFTMAANSYTRTEKENPHSINLDSLCNCKCMTKRLHIRVYSMYNVMHSKVYKKGKFIAKEK